MRTPNSGNEKDVGSWVKLRVEARNSEGVLPHLGSGDIFQAPPTKNSEKSSGLPSRLVSTSGRECAQSRHREVTDVWRGMGRSEGDVTEGGV